MAAIYLTSGEPAGIGPDIILQAAAQGLLDETVVLGDSMLFQQRAKRLNLDLIIDEAWQQHATHKKARLRVWHVPLRKACTPGILRVENVDYVLQLLNEGSAACLEGGGALVTAPIHKGIINEAGLAFSGHTEYLAQQSGVQRVVMMLACPQFKVALMTTHLPLCDVPSAISPELIQQVMTLLERHWYQYFSNQKPKFYVAGLNPHAGEGGHMGREEGYLIAPTLEQLRQQGMRIEGPLPADTMFSQENIAQADVFVAMYHDQGLPVLKYAGFGDAVNITIGLPYIRTSVDHGTALELAGTAKASHQSLVAAVKMAKRMQRTRDGN